MTRLRARGMSAAWVGALQLGVCLSGAAVHAYDETYREIPGGAFDLGDGPVPYSLDPAGSDDVGDDSDLDALRAAFRAWSCVPGTALRFVEEGEGVHEASLEDSVNTLFWDETGEYGLGPGTLGVTVGDAGQGTRAQADIIFNGSDHAWSTDDGPSGTDVGSIAIHEIGHFLGLDHPCDQSGGNETNCNGPEVSIMTPAWDNQVGRVPLPDDEDGVRALYPASDPDARCDGPFQRGERCTCDGECIEGLVCAPSTAGDLVCSETCASDQGDCGGGFVCVLDAPEGDESAPGVCIKSDPGGFPPASVCTNSGQCAEGSCSIVQAVGRSVCRTDCEGDADCGETGRCVDGACLIAMRSIACPDDPPEGCGCSSHKHASSAPWGIAALLLAAAQLGRRRRTLA
jgi:MYXO-CTERM domain-containing protein